MNAEDKVKKLMEENAEYLTADGFDEAIMGTVERFGMNDVVLYDKAKCMDILMKRDGMTEDEAIDFFYYNVIGSWVGEYTPYFAEIY
jgi:hypothetical protein|tara:strand:- start:207 stop:467 length:261 start_codon:yes stop_codon:yes gene_type:complete